MADFHVDNIHPDRERSPVRGGGRGDKFKILLKNLPYHVNWMKLKDLVKEHVGPVIFADVIKTRDGRSAGFGSAEFGNMEEAREAVEKLNGLMMDGRDIRVDLDIGEHQLLRMCYKQDLDPRPNIRGAGGPPGGQSGGGPPRGPPSRSGGGSFSSRYGGNGPYGGHFPGEYDGPGHFPSSNRYDDPGPRGQVPMINGRPLTEYPGMERLNPEVMDAIGAGPVGKNIFVRNLDFKVDEEKMKEVFGMAGSVDEVTLNKDSEGKSRGMGVISFSQPMEAVKAIVMFHTQQLFGRAMYCKMDRKNNEKPAPAKAKLPEGLSGVNINPDSFNLPKVAEVSQTSSSVRDPYNGYHGGSGCVITVDRLPPSATTARLRRLFEDTGRVAFVELQEHGRASIRFESAYDAERAVGRFNGYMIEGHQLAARITD